MLYACKEDEHANGSPTKETPKLQGKTRSKSRVLLGVVVVSFVMMAIFLISTSLGVSIISNSNNDDQEFVDGNKFNKTETAKPSFWPGFLSQYRDELTATSLLLAAGTFATSRARRSSSPEHWYLKESDLLSFEDVLPYPIYYLSRDQVPVISTLPQPDFLHFVVDAFEKNDDVNGLWVSHRQVAKACGYSTAGIEKAVKEYGHYAWAGEFENVHSTWRFNDKGVWDDELEMQWPSSEHYFQFQKRKLDGNSVAAAKQLAGLTGEEAAHWGRQLKEGEFVGQAQWEGMKVDVMRQAIAFKFDQNAAIQGLLESTKEIRLVSVKNDAYWGYPGVNQLALLLEERRDQK